MANFETPALREYPIIPLLRADSMAHSRTFVAKAEYQTPIGFPGELVENWEQKAVAKLGGARDMTKDVLDEWYTYFHQCSQCRRCSVFCPYGIDTAEISMAAREIMDSIGMGQKYSNEIIGKVHTIGNT